MNDPIAPIAISPELAKRWNISSSFLVADTPSSTIYRVVLGSDDTAMLRHSTCRPVDLLVAE